MTDSLPQELSSLAALTRLLSEAALRADERAKHSHDRFNIFVTLLGRGDEVRLHSRLLHSLLDPKGTHDYGELFLKLFWETLTEVPCYDNAGNVVSFGWAWESDSWETRKEVSNGVEGSIDLLLTRKGKAIAIENKIFAGEQHNQLKRYSAFLSRWYSSGYRLLYLTLDGRQSFSHGGTPYLRISYREHILAWLEKCLRETYRIIPINQILIQYREVVRQLTGQTMEAATLQNAAEFVSRNPDIIKFRLQLDQIIARAKADFLDRFMAALMQELGTKYPVRSRSSKFGTDPNAAFLIRLPETSPLAGIEVTFEHIAKWQGLVVGIEEKHQQPPLQEDVLTRLRQVNQLMLEYQKTHSYHTSSPIASSEHTLWPTGWHNLCHPFDDIQLAGFLSEPLENVVAKFREGIEQHIKIVEDLYIRTGKEAPPAGNPAAGADPNANKA